MINEFAGATFTTSIESKSISSCDVNVSLVDTLTNRDCLQCVAAPGLFVTVLGDTYLKETYGIDYSDPTGYKWGVIALLFAYGCVFVGIATAFLNYFRFDRSAHLMQYNKAASKRPQTKEL